MTSPTENAHSTVRFSPNSTQGTSPKLKIQKTKNEISIQKIEQSKPDLGSPLPPKKISNPRIISPMSPQVKVNRSNLHRNNGSMERSKPIPIQSTPSSAQSSPVANNHRLSQSNPNMPLFKPESPSSPYPLPSPPSNPNFSEDSHSFNNLQALLKKVDKISTGSKLFVNSRTEIAKNASSDDLPEEFRLQAQIEEIAQRILEIVKQPHKSVDQLKTLSESSQQLNLAVEKFVGGFKN